MEAFCGDDPPPMTYADLDKRLTRALNATMPELRVKAGLEEGRPTPQSPSDPGMPTR
jgi:hypothetical protein